MAITYAYTYSYARRRRGDNFVTAWVFELTATDDVDNQTASRHFVVDVSTPTKIDTGYTGVELDGIASAARTAEGWEATLDADIVVARKRASTATFDHTLIVPDVSPYSNTKSVIFDGSNDYVVVGDVAALSFERTSAFSFSAWIKATSTGNRAIISKYLGSNSNDGTMTNMDSGDIVTDSP
jgi:hypothetical protein